MAKSNKRKAEDDKQRGKGKEGKVDLKAVAAVVSPPPARSTFLAKRAQTAKNALKARRQKAGGIER